MILMNNEEKELWKAFVLALAVTPKGLGDADAFKLADNVVDAYRKRV